jgi:hypothetical protein
MTIDCPDCDGRRVIIRKLHPQRCPRCKGTGRVWINQYSAEFHPGENKQSILIQQHIFIMPMSVATNPGLLDALMLAARLDQPFRGGI